MTLVDIKYIWDRTSEVHVELWDLLTSQVAFGAFTFMGQRGSFSTPSPTSTLCRPLGRHVGMTLDNRSITKGNVTSIAPIGCMGLGRRHWRSAKGRLQCDDLPARGVIPQLRSGGQVLDIILRICIREKPNYMSRPLLSCRVPMTTDLAPFPFHSWGRADPVLSMQMHSIRHHARRREYTVQ